MRKYVAMILEDAAEQLHRERRIEEDESYKQHL